MEKGSKSILIFCFILAPLVSGAVEEKLSQYIGRKNFSRVLDTGELSRSFMEGGSLVLLPQLPLRDTIKYEVSQLNPVLGVEILMLYQRAGTPLDSLEGLLGVFNILRSISTMKGLTYYSTSRKKMQILFQQSYAVASQEKQVLINDPLMDEIPGRTELFIFQEDTTFGKNLYQVTYTFPGDLVSMKIENLTTIRYFLLPLIQPRNLLNYFLFIPSGDQVLFYGVSCLHTTTPLVDRKSREESLHNRLVAMFTWFKGRLDKSRPN